MSLEAGILSLSSKLGEKMDWRKWDSEIPYLDPSPLWRVKARPPFGGAMVRYHVRDKLSHHELSIYLDCHNSLGIYRDEEGESKPYWEIYPCASDYNGEGAVQRIDMNADLEKEIEKEFNNRRNLFQRLLTKVLA